MLKYLGQLLDCLDKDRPAVLFNIRNARQVWGRLGNIIWRERSEPAVLAKFYRAVIQAVLFFWGGDLGVVGANGTEAGRTSCGVLATGDEVEEKKAEGRFVAEGGGRKSTSGSRDTTAPYLLGQEAGDSGRMGGLTAYIQCMHEG